MPGQPAEPGRRRVGHSAYRATHAGNRLAYYLRYAEHTAAVQEVFVSFICAARTAVTMGSDHALDVWQGEWAALRRYPYQGQWHTLRPDAYGRYHAGATALTFFLEVDRGTCGLRDLAAKLAAYCAYRDFDRFTCEPVDGGATFPALLVVTTSDERLRNILVLARSVADDRTTSPLMVWGTTAPDLVAHGPLGPIWHDPAQHPPHRLWPDAVDNTKG
jgi:hypothetical protein